MTTSPKTKSHFEQLLSEIYARESHENNKCVKSVSNQDQIEKSLSEKIVVTLNSMCSIIKILHLNYGPVCNV